MEWRAILSEDSARFYGGTIAPEGTSWDIDTSCLFPAMVRGKCATLNIDTNFPFTQYIELFGEDNHLWKVTQQIDSEDAKIKNTLPTQFDNKWTMLDLGDKITGHCFFEISTKKNRRTVKEGKSVLHDFSFEEYMDFFGEDDHMNNQEARQRRFDL